MILTKETEVLSDKPFSMPLFCTQLAHGRARFKRDGTSAETRFRLSEKRTSPFESAGVST
jgi:hypothetical protein